MPNGEVEEMDLDEYVKGVVPQEMPASWPKAALKAQAIAAKCYAATSIPINGIILRPMSAPVHTVASAGNPITILPLTRP